MSSDSTNTGRILIVEDEEIMRHFLCDILEDDGYEVTTASTGEIAVEQLQESHFDVVISDIKMPGISGMEVLKKAKALDASTHVIMITGYASVDTAVEAMKSGAFDYLTKPFDMQQIRDSICAAIKQRQK